MRITAHQRLNHSLCQSSASAVLAASFLGCLAVPAQAQTAGPPDEAAEAEASSEIIVTAQKRNERLHDVPVPVTVIAADSLIKSNQTRLQDYYTKVPGLTVSYDGTRSGLPSLTIRGLRTSTIGNPTVGIVIDELAYGSSQSVGGGLWVPEIDPGDLERVEVLRGPQGTLYGAGSMGGLLKFVTIAPSVDRLSGRIQVGGNSVTNGGQLGYSARGAINIPLGDTVAIRASGFTRRDPGYIDNPTLGLEGVNKADVYGGRLSALWRPSDALTVRLSALQQKYSADGSANVYPALGGIRQNNVINTGWLRRKSEVYDATITGKIGELQATSVTGYTINTNNNSVDVTTLFLAGPQSIDETNRSKKFTQELRLSVPLGSSFDLLVGGFYGDEHSQFRSPRYAIDTATGLRSTLFPFGTQRTSFEEYAAFSNLTWTITDRFDVQIGGRYSRNAYKIGGTNRNAAGVITINPQLSGNEDAFTYLFTPRLRISPNLMTYIRLASGYRAGGLNRSAIQPGNSDLPLNYKPDYTRNYEIGIKGDVFHNALSFEASLYYIDWRDIQLSLIAPGRVPIAGYDDNGGRAKSQGIELSFDLRPTRGLTISASGSLGGAKLTQDLPSSSTVRGFDGDRLPYGSKVSGSISVSQEFDLSENVTAFVGATASYVGKRLGVFTGPGMSSPLPSLPRQVYPSYTQIDARAGFKVEETWSIDFYVNNLTNKRALLSGGLGNLFPTAFSITQPRSIGFSVTKEF